VANCGDTVQLVVTRTGMIRDGALAPGTLLDLAVEQEVVATVEDLAAGDWLRGGRNIACRSARSRSRGAVTVTCPASGACATCARSVVASQVGSSTTTPRSWAARINQSLPRRRG
jgi:hypothetical protein